MADDLRKIKECRKSFGGGGGGGLLSMFGRKGATRDYEVDCAEDKVPPSLVDPYKTLLDSGRIVWAYALQTDDAAYSPGKEDVSANVLHSDDAYFDDNSAVYRNMSRSIGALAETTPEDPSTAAFIRLLGDPGRTFNHEPLPGQLTQDRPVSLSTVVLHRGRLPEGVLVAAPIPLLVCPEKTKTSMVLPLKYWAPELVQTWVRVGQMASGRVGAGVSAPAAPPAPAEPVAPPVEAPPEPPARVDPVDARARFETAPVQLTPAAAEEVRTLLADALPGSALRVRATAEATGVTHAVEIEPQFGIGPDDLTCESHGIRLVVDPESAPHLAGVRIDFQADAFGAAFVFLDD